MYLKKNASEEDEVVPEDIADYYKGEVFVIIEEFTLSLVELPKVNDYLMQGISKSFYLLSSISIKASELIENKSGALQFLPIEKKSLFQIGLLLDPWYLTLDHYDQVKIIMIMI